MVAGNDSWQLMECQHGTAYNVMPQYGCSTPLPKLHIFSKTSAMPWLPMGASVLGLHGLLQGLLHGLLHGLHARSIGDGPAGLMDALHHLGCNLLVLLWDILQGGTMGQVAGKPGQSTHLAAGQLVQSVAPHPTWTAWVGTIGVPSVAQPMVVGHHHPWRWASSWASPWHWASSWASPWHWPSSWQPSWMAWLHTEGLGSQWVSLDAWSSGCNCKHLKWPRSLAKHWNAIYGYTLEMPCVAMT